MVMQDRGYEDISDEDREEERKPLENKMDGI